MSKISVVIPCFNEEKSLPDFFECISEVSVGMPQQNFEFIYVDDGSADCTLSLIKEAAHKDVRIKYISLSRNFGKEAAMFAGLEKAVGDYVAIMDADLQDPPSMLPEMVALLTQDDRKYDCVATRRVNRDGEPPIRSFFARLYYKIMRKISKVDIVDGARDFRIMSRQMVDAILSMQEYNRFSKGIFAWVGFRTKWLSYVNVKRAAGETKWSFWKLFVYSIEGLVSFSTVPLALASVFGVIFCLISFLMIIFIVVRTAIWGDPVGGWPTMMCTILLIGGIQLFTIGILGQYMAKTYLEVKKRPIYIVRETEETTKEK